MSRPHLRAAFAGVLLVLTMSACDMTVRIGTAVEADGSGRFSIGITMDREMRDALEQSEGDNLQTLEALFDGLQQKGWAVTTSQPQGGIEWEATRAFADSAEFDRALGELGNAQQGTTDGLTGLKLEVDQRVERSFLRTNANFSGSIDTTGGEAIPDDARALVKAMGEVVRFEIQAELPGAVVEQAGDGTVRDGTVVWRPGLGTSLDFSARSSALNTGALMALLVPALGLLAGSGWFLVRRRRGPAPITIEPAPIEEIVTEPAPNGFLAIKPLESIDLRPIGAEQVEPERDPDPV